MYTYTYIYICIHIHIHIYMYIQITNWTVTQSSNNLQHLGQMISARPQKMAAGPNCLEFRQTTPIDKGNVVWQPAARCNFG